LLRASSVACGHLPPAASRATAALPDAGPVPPIGSRASLGSSSGADSRFVHLVQTSLRPSKG
jgi:hypothetical protein